MASKIGDLLVKADLISPEQLETALQEQRQNGGLLGSNLIKLGYIEEKYLTSFLSDQYGVPAINLSEFEIDPDVIKIIPSDVAKKHHVLPVNRAGATLVVAMADPTNIYAIDDLKFMTGYNIEVVVAAEASILAAIQQYYEEEQDDHFSDLISEFEEEEMEVLTDDEDLDEDELEKSSEEAPVVKLVNLILFEAIKRNASDIHVEPYEKLLRVRFRVDGVLQEVMKPPFRLKNAIVSRLKIMAQLDIAERRLPQDGRIKLKVSKEKEMDFRVSVLPTLFGEKVVLRLLDKSNLQLDMTKLGFEPKQLQVFKSAIFKPWGMVLVTGPTGSGKTTTLYSALTELNKVTENISTAEDPVEYNLVGINQVQMHEEIGLNFAACLRAFLRQDPDIIMVGEIRDFETAEIAVKAALTGHLVLSTLHTNDAPSTINRLLNMGVEPFLVASSVNCIMAQRLCRKICVNCKEKLEVPPQALIDIGVPPDEVNDYAVHKGRGCKVCSDTGYKGRIAMYEVLDCSEEIRELILNGASSTEIKREAMRQGMKTLRQSALGKLKDGVTTMEEVVRTTIGDS